MVREGRPLAAALGLRATAADGARVWQGATATVWVVGVGPDRASTGAERVLATLHPTRVLVAGVAGATRPGLSVGDLLAPDAVVDTRSGATLRPHRPRDAHRVVGHRGTLATVARFGDPVPSGAVAVDMETAAVAAVCEAAGVPWDVRRTVSDTAGEVAPAVAGLVSPGGTVDGLAVARLLVRRPVEVATLVGLAGRTRRAMRALTEAVVAELRAEAQRP